MSENRSLIQQQALLLFAARGYESVGVQDIVSAAGVTKPTLYHYFGSKRGLLEAMLKEGVVPLQDSMTVAVADAEDLLMALRRVAREAFQFANDRPAFSRFLLSAQYAPRESDSYQSVEPYLARLLRLIQDLFAHRLPHMTDRKERYAITFFGMINTYISMSLQGDLVLDDELVYTLVQQFLHGIYS